MSTHDDSTAEQLDIDVIRLARRSEDFRRVLLTGSNMHVVVMTIPPGEEIGEETHENGDQMLFFVDGRGEAVLEGESSPVEAGHLVFVPAGTLHNFINSGDEPLRTVTAYAPRSTSTARCTTPARKARPTSTITEGSRSPASVASEYEDGQCEHEDAQVRPHGHTVDVPEIGVHV